MQQSLQAIFTSIQGKKREQRRIRKEYRDVLSTDPEYVKLIDQLEILKKRKAQIEQKAKDSMGKRWVYLEDLANEIKSEQEMMSDVALNTLMNGQTVEVKDIFENEYDPEFKVNFKRK